ncbi:MAG TPA: hypothetical protein VHS97_21675, partial [Isosphaeraceae bacterium]|nr:hypothetical protein [Isosphaeraceae bacterium]
RAGNRQQHQEPDQLDTPEHGFISTGPAKSPNRVLQQNCRITFVPLIWAIVTRVDPSWDDRGGTTANTARHHAIVAFAEFLAFFFGWILEKL